jgi:hypothetical protein
MEGKIGRKREEGKGREGRDFSVAVRVKGNLIISMVICFITEFTRNTSSFRFLWIRVLTCLLPARLEIFRKFVSLVRTSDL